jgi:hypothetical protein
VTDPWWVWAFFFKAGGGQGYRRVVGVAKRAGRKQSALPSITIVDIIDCRRPKIIRGIDIYRSFVRLLTGLLVYSFFRILSLGI